MRLLLSALVLLAVTATLLAQTPTYPSSTAKAEGVSPAALERLDELVRGFVADGDVVGAELLVLVNGRSILHEAYGWRDREKKLRMGKDTVFCVRSMTKPLIGTAILMLVGDGALALDDRVAKYLPSFDKGRTADITIEHLLMHMSGLPMSLILGEDLKGLEGIGGVAALASEKDLRSRPGSKFSYSDQGTDTLTAVIGAVTGKSPDVFVRDRILQPLGMRDSTCVLAEGHPLRDRASSLYVGTAGEWKRFWEPAEPPLFPFFLGSQGLYSTVFDYARFLDLWRANGRVGEDQLLDPALVRRALTPGPDSAMPPMDLAEFRAGYGYLMQVWNGPDAERDAGPAVFGHSGSDGTYAWAFPEQRATVLYFTQSRYSPTGLRLQEALGSMFLGTAAEAEVGTAPPHEDYLGYYRQNEKDLYRAIIRDGDDLALEVSGRGVVPLRFVGDDRWKMQPNPSVVLEFDRAEDGRVTGFRIGDQREYRFEPGADLPSAGEVAARVAKTHRIDLIESVGPVRLTSDLEMPKIRIKGKVSTLLAWPNRFREESVVNGEFEHVAFDGKVVRYQSKRQPVTELDAARADAARLGSALVRLGDWRDNYEDLRVIQKIPKGGKQVFIVRAGDTSGAGVTFYVDSKTGRLMREERMTFVENAGRIGQRITFGDYSEVSGMLLPHQTRVDMAIPHMGPIVIRLQNVEVGVELAEDAFVLKD